MLGSKYTYLGQFKTIKRDKFLFWAIAIMSFFFYSPVWLQLNKYISAAAAASILLPLQVYCYCCKYTAASILLPLQVYSYCCKYIAALDSACARLPLNSDTFSYCFITALSTALFFFLLHGLLYRCDIFRTTIHSTVLLCCLLHCAAYSVLYC